VLVTLKLQPVHIHLFFYNKIITNDFFYYYKHIYKRFLHGGLGYRRNISEQIVYPEHPILNRPLLHLSHRLSTTFHLQRMSPYKRRKRIGYSWWIADLKKKKLLISSIKQQRETFKKEGNIVPWFTWREKECLTLDSSWLGSGIGVLLGLGNGLSFEWD